MRTNHKWFTAAAVLTVVGAVPLLIFLPLPRPGPQFDISTEPRWVYPVPIPIITTAVFFIEPPPWYLVLYTGLVVALLGEGVVQTFLEKHRATGKSSPPTCPRCGYDMRANWKACSECGWTAQAVRSISPRDAIPYYPFSANAELSQDPRDDAAMQTARRTDLTPFAVAPWRLTARR